MAAALWTKNPDGDWVPTTLFAATGTSSGANSWKYAAKVYEKTGATTWTQRWARATTPPVAPTITVGSINAAAKTALYTITMPVNASLTKMIIKLSTTGYPSNPVAATDPTGTYYTRLAADGTVWSQRTVTSAQVVLRDLNTLVANTTYYATVWVYDSNGNISLGGKVSFKFPAVIAPTPVPVAKSLYLVCTDSASWMGDDNFWRTDNNYVYQAGRDSYGQWYYSTAIQAALAKATEITAVLVYIQRVNSSHGVAGPANVRLSYHKNASQPAGSPEGTMVTGTLVGTLNRGEGKWFNVPSSWWAGLKSGGIRGLGLRYGTTTFVDNDYLIGYGKGTFGGRIHMTWKE